jgi:hypothetical protein
MKPSQMYPGQAAQAAHDRGISRGATSDTGTEQASATQAAVTHVR